MKVNPWQELDRKGLLTPGNGNGRPVRESLTEDVRQGLLDSLERLEDAGVELRYDRRLGPDRRLTPAEALARLEEAPPEKPLRFRATTPDGREVQVQCLTDLESLEYRHGAGADALSDRHRALAKSVQGLEEAGVGVISDYEFLARAGEKFPFGEVASRDHVYYKVETVEELLALNYLVGDGRDHGMREPATADGVRALYDRGLAVAAYHGKRLDPFQAWETAEAGQGAWVLHEQTWGPYLESGEWPAALGDIPALEAATADAERVGEAHLAGLYERMRGDTYSERAAMRAILPLGDWTLEEAATAYATLDAALQDRHVIDLEPRTSLYEAVAARCHKGSDLTLAALRLADDIRRDGPGGVEQAARAVQSAVTQPRQEVERMLADADGPQVHVGTAEVRIGEVTLQRSGSTE